MTYIICIWLTVGLIFGHLFAKTHVSEEPDASSLGIGVSFVLGVFCWPVVVIVGLFFGLLSLPGLLYTKKDKNK